MWLSILTFFGVVFAQEYRSLKLRREPDVGVLRLPPPHLRTSYFYPTVFSDSGAPDMMGIPPMPPPNPPPLPRWFPPLSNAFTGPAFDYQNELLTALQYPFLYNPGPPDDYLSQVESAQRAPARPPPSPSTSSSSGAAPAAPASPAAPAPEAPVGPGSPAAPPSLGQAKLPPSISK
eukprot:Gregarina_sp_Pseudo_9__2336@NODE_2649_length_923_cov_6_973982_g2429_i0_p1_GENE_NODE_2649_length_923_cov_6_973982_g2429_i0NODE_2649_length_923_cov_6_973982_g2429_i0_p1_ORF_typecomplete_len176_score24_68MAP65_ASE1/PF03999_12/0_34_NODE_2649_length_923_cov_6_973982_g2429_i0372899